MTQTMKGNPNPDSRQVRPGQRQQDRLQRLARRRRRRQIAISVIMALVVVVLASLGFWEFQRYSADQLVISNQHATATAITNSKHATATGVVLNQQATATGVVLNQQATATAQIIAKTPTPVVPAPTAPAAAPPTLTQTPVTLADGLQYIDITEGSGLPAQQGATVSVYYTGWLQNTGQKFDSSFDHGGQSFDVTPLGQAQIIPGWNEGLIGMKSGGTRRLIIPPALGYGSQAQGPIPANSTLIFDVTVKAIK